MGLAAALTGGIVVAGPAGAQDDKSLTADDLLALERALVSLNFDPGEIDGAIDERTRTAIRLYQEFAALTPDGLVTQALLAEVLSVAQSFSDLRATRAAEQAAAQPIQPATPEAVPDTMPAEAVSEAEEPPGQAADQASTASQAPLAAQQAVPQASPAAPPEPADDAEIAESPAQAPEAQAPDARAPEPDTPEVESPEAQAPESQAPEAQAPETPAPAQEPAQETAMAEPAPPKTAPPELVPPEPAPPESVGSGPAAPMAEPGQAAPEGESKPSADGGFDIGGVISRLVKNGEQADKARTEASGDAPAAPSGMAESAQVARVPRGHTDGYGAFQEAFRAAKAGEFEAAIDRYTDAIKSKKLTLEHLADAHFNRANAFHYLGQYDKAIDDYGAAVGNNPTFAGAYYNRGFAHDAKGDRRRAVDDFRKARDLGLQRLGVRAPDIAPPLR